MDSIYFKDAKQFYKEMATQVSDVSTNKHTLFYNADMPVSYELSYITMLLDEITKFMFAQSACDNGYSEYLTRKCADLGVDRKLAQSATGTIKVTGRVNSKLPAESMVSTVEGVVFITDTDLVIDSTGVGYVTITAKEKGSKYNVEANTITTFPLKYSGIISITNEEKIVNGYDEESDYDLLERYLFKIRTTATSGNANHYKIWATEVNGVGKCKVFETTNEKGEEQNGHVLVIITDSNKRKASEELLTACYNHIEDERPVNAKVHVISAGEVPLNISATIYFDSTQYSLEDIKKKISNSITNYLKEKAFSETDKSTYVSYNKIGSIISDTVEVEDYDALLINGGTSRINIKNTEIPVLGTLEITEGTLS
ncbi:baseplate J/gp47 family protein [uncultured Clostridium sp.]|uniref:baseplate J/gp47 family protein n=1 Tax=uncultured Clostridium sp. TaxID=59620 RepID=UPI0025CDBF0B|nr:baseplate J/gp47 family protein [uncultured Clostridium sp.]